jgi:hypothetical protein
MNNQHYLAPGLTPPPPLFRLDRGDTRYYAHVDSAGLVTWYPSVTSVIKETGPTPYGLQQWQMKHGEAEAKRLRDEAAEYGTELHINIARYFAGEAIEPTSERMTKDMLAWHAFVRERNVVPIASEVMLHSDTLRVAGTADLVCELDWQKGRVVAMVDIKSGKNSYRDHAVQLAFYSQMWNECYPDMEIDAIFNWHPKDWTKTTPTYALINQTGEVKHTEVALRANLWHELFLAAPKAQLSIQGSIRQGQAMPTITLHDPDDYARIMFEQLNREAIVMPDDHDGVVWGFA